MDLEVGEGELVGLLGPNGAGQVDAHEDRLRAGAPDRGQREACGAPAGSAQARAATGYLAELFRFPGWATADELLELHQRLARSDGGAAERAELLELVGLDGGDAPPVEAMSKGMQQRLGIAQALIGAPRLVLLDEPTSALDPAGRRIVRGMLEGLRGRGVAVLLNSHLLSEVELVCDRVVIIARGRVITEGAPDELAAGRRRGGRDRGRARAGSPTRGARGRAADRRASWSPRASACTACASCAATLEDAYLEAVEGT